MAELEEKLNAILGDQEAMGKIMALARSLSGRQEPPAPDEGPAGGEPEPAGEGGAPLPEDLSALLITHAHSDHIAGLATLVRRRPLPIYATAEAARQVAYRVAGAQPLLRPLPADGRQFSS